MLKKYKFASKNNFWPILDELIFTEEEMKILAEPLSRSYFDEISIKTIFETNLIENNNENRSEDRQSESPKD